MYPDIYTVIIIIHAFVNICYVTTKLYDLPIKVIICILSTRDIYIPILLCLYHITYVKMC